MFSFYSTEFAQLSQIDEIFLFRSDFIVISYVCIVYIALLGPRPLNLFLIDGQGEPNKTPLLSHVIEYWNICIVRFYIGWV